MYGIPPNINPTLPNPSASQSIGDAEEKLAQVVDGLAESERRALYNLLHASGCRVEPNFMAEWRRRWKANHMAVEGEPWRRGHALPPGGIVVPIELLDALYTRRA